MTSGTVSPTPEELVRMATQNPLLGDLDSEHLTGLEDALRWVSLEAGQDLFHEGDEVDAFFFVIDGLLQVTTLQENLDGNEENDLLVLAEVPPGETIGEMQILTGGRRTATVTAKDPSHLIRFSKEGFDRFLATDPRVVAELEKTIIPRLYRDQMVDVLPKLFGELDERTLKDLESKLTWRHIKRGQVVIRQGDPSDSFYVIISGRLRAVIRTAEGKDRIINEMSQGECVGEMGVFTGAPRSATIIASRDTELIEFSKAEFDEFMEKYPQLMRHMTQLLINRLQRAYRETPIANLSVNVLLAAASDDAPLDEFARQLHEAVSQLNSCLLLTSHRVDELLSRQGISQADEGEPDDLRLRSWLNEQEKKYDFLIFQADATATDWTRRCIRQADEIMYLARADSKPRPTAIVEEVNQQEQENQTRRRRSLVLLHPSGAQRPQGTLPWLQQFQLVRPLFERHFQDRHFHVRCDRPDDYQRVARFVTSREVGLVLSGGGARGFAHVGFIRAMRDLKIPIDMIAGVSMGSLVGAAYAYAPDDFDATIDTIKGRLQGALFDITPPMVAIARGRRFDRRLKEWFGDVQIEDLWVPYFCVSSNLTQANIAIHEHGDLWWGVRASGSLPGLVAPIIHEGNLLFDGCLLDNLPMDVMRDRLGRAQVIAVDVVPPHDLAVDVTDIQSPSGWYILWSKLNPFVKPIRLPSIVSILHRAGELGSVYGRQKLIEENQEQHIADLYFQPREVEKYEILDFEKVDVTSQIGFEKGKERLKDWLATRGTSGPFNAASGAPQA